MRAFVLSGGGARGAMQVGALQALLERGIYPDMIVGTSIGAINGAGLALDPTVSGLSRLRQTWSGVRQRDLGFATPVKIALRLLTGRDNLGASRRLYRLICDYLGDVWLHFGAFEQVALRVTAVDLDRGTLTVFGDDPRDSVVDALMASTALHPYLAAWDYLDRRYVDGGVWSNLPLQVAVERGATEIYAIDLTRARFADNRPTGVTPILWRMADIGIRAMRDRELTAARSALGDRLHHIELPSQLQSLSFTEFPPQQLVEEGHWCTEYYLDMLEKDTGSSPEPPLALSHRLEMVCGNGSNRVPDERTR